MPTGTKPPQEVGVAKAEALGTLGPSTWANVFYFAIGSFDPAHLDDVITMVGDTVFGLYHDGFTAGTFPNDWHIKTTKIAFRDASDSLYRATVADAMAGTGGAEVEAAQVAYLLNYTTNDPRRGGKPRQYISGVSDDLMTDSVTVDPTTVAALNGRLATWLAGAIAASHGTASGCQPIEESFVDGGAYRATAHSWPIRGITVNPVIATQRRRVDRQRP